METPYCIKPPHASVKTVSHRRFPGKIKDDRFNHVKKEKWFLCDRSHKVVEFGGQDMPHDGGIGWNRKKACLSLLIMGDGWLERTSYGIAQIAMLKCLGSAQVALAVN